MGTRFLATIFHLKFCLKFLIFFLILLTDAARSGTNTTTNGRTANAADAATRHARNAAGPDDGHGTARANDDTG